jgi:hypothetical protein
MIVRIIAELFFKKNKEKLASALPSIQSMWVDPATACPKNWSKF